MGNSLTLARIFSEPGLAGAPPRRPSPSPDGSRVAYLREQDENGDCLDLRLLDVASGEHRLLVEASEPAAGAGALSDEENARRERQRIAGLAGVVDYQWTADGQGLVFSLGGTLYLHDLQEAASRPLVADAASITDPQVAPDAAWVAFVRDQDLHAVEVDSGREVRLTRDGGGTVKNGMAEFIAQEEMGRATGYWWSPDASRIAFLQVDEAPVPLVRRQEIHAGRIDVVEQRYPAAGDANVRNRLGVVDLASQRIRWLDLGDETDIYVPRVDWFGPDRLAVQVQSRDQRRLELWAVCPSDGSRRRLLSETAETWVNLHDDFRPLAEGRKFLWSSEADGHRHLFLHDADGRPLRRLTAGPWQVDAVAGVDEPGGWVYFTATAESPLERHLYRVSLDSEGVHEPERLTRAAGWHEVVMSESARLFVDSHSTRDQPPQVALCSADGTRLAWLHRNRVDDDHPYAPYRPAHRPTVFGMLEAADGQTLHYRLTRPSGPAPAGGFPALVHVYGGPHVQMVTQAWSRGVLVEQYFAQQGYVVFALDNRGSARRGIRFENAIHGAMGSVDVADQALGAAWLAGLEEVDAERIGVFGGSYGGYLTLHLLFRHREHFAAGVAVAPVTDWLLYDTHYTERYLGLPGDDPDRYRSASVFPYTEDFSGQLLVIHGMADDNVLFTHSTRLFAHLQRQGVLFDAMPYPGAKHGISGQALQAHLYRTIARFFTRHLRPGGERHATGPL